MIDNETTPEPVKRKRRTKAEMQAEVPTLSDEIDALYSPSGSALQHIAVVSTADLQPMEELLAPERYIRQCLLDAKLARNIAEVHPFYEADNTVRRVEFRGTKGVSFIVPGFGEVIWVTYTGTMKEFPNFLSKITTNITIDV